MLALAAGCGDGFDHSRTPYRTPITLCLTPEPICPRAARVESNGMASSALYYPYIRPRDDEWLKTAALVWHHVARIVPPAYRPRDSHTARVLESERILISEDPEKYARQIQPNFLRVLIDHSDELRRRYSLDQFDLPELVRWRQHRRRTEDGWGRRESAPRGVAWIHTTKVAYSLTSALEDVGLAVHAGSWLGVHEQIARVYMAALAGELARSGNFDAVTDQPDAAVLSGAWGHDELITALLEPIGQSTEYTADESEWRLALCAIELVAPAGVSSLPVEDVVELRAKSGSAFQAFRLKLDSLHPTLLSRLEGVTDRGQMQRIISEVRDEHFRSELNNLRSRLRSANILALSRTMAVQISIPAMAGEVVTQATGIPLLGLGVGVTLAVGGVAASLASRVQDARRDSPGTYLFDIERRLRRAR